MYSVFCFIRVQTVNRVDGDTVVVIGLVVSKILTRDDETPRDVCI